MNRILFDEVFSGELLDILTSLRQEMTVSTEEGNMVENGYLNVTGYIIDHDDAFYYIAEDLNFGVNRALRKDIVLDIQIAKDVEEQLNDGLDKLFDINKGKMN